MKWRKVRLNYAKAPFPLRLFSIGMKKIQPNSNLNNSFKGKYEFLNYFLCCWDFAFKEIYLKRLYHNFILIN